MEPGQRFLAVQESSVIFPFSSLKVVFAVGLLLVLAVVLLSVKVARGWARIWLLMGIACLALGSVAIGFLGLLAIFLGDQLFLLAYWSFPSAAAACAVMALVAHRGRPRSLTWLPTLLLCLPLAWLIAAEINGRISGWIAQRQYAEQQTAQQRAEQNRDPHINWLVPEGYSLTVSNVLGIPQWQAVAWPRLMNVMSVSGSVGLRGKVYSLTATACVEIPNSLEGAASGGTLSGLLGPLPGFSSQNVNVGSVLKRNIVGAEAAVEGRPGVSCAELTLPKSVMASWKTKEPNAELGAITLELGGKTWHFPGVLRSGRQ